MENVVVLKRYNQPSRAHLDAALLTDNNIECQVNGDNLVNITMPGGEQVSLMVKQSDVERAMALLDEARL